MLPFPTPRKLAAQGEFYRQLSTLTSVGIGVMGALEQLRLHPPSASLATTANSLLIELQGGATLAGALEVTGHRVPEFDKALIEAGEKSGRLDQCFGLLADYYDESSRLLRQTISGLAYPVLLIHAAVFILPFAAFFTSGNLLGYLFSTLGLLVPMYLATGLLFYALRGDHSEAWRLRLERYSRRIPLVGAARHNLALARLAAALEALVNAGVSILRAWPLAAAASGSPTIRRVVAGWKLSLEGGRTPAELVRESREFPDLFGNLYHTGEISGKLDQELRHLHRLYKMEGFRLLQLLAEWTPRLVYFMVVIVVAWQIIKFWLGYFAQINAAIQ